MDFSKTHLIILLSAILFVMFVSMVAITIGFTVDMETFKSETSSAQQEQQVAQTNINSSFEIRLQQIQQEFRDAQLQQERQQNLINSSFDGRLLQLRLEISLAQQQQLEQQISINSSFGARLSKLNEVVSQVQEEQKSINSSFDSRLLELQQNFASSQQEQLQQQAALNSSIDIRLQGIMQNLNSTQQQQIAINSSLETQLQEITEEFNRALEEQLDQQNAINSSFVVSLQNLMLELDSARQEQLNLQASINESFQLNLQDIRQNIDLAQNERSLLNSSFDLKVQQLELDIELASENREELQKTINSTLERLQDLELNLATLNTSITSANKNQAAINEDIFNNILLLNSSINEFLEQLVEELSITDGNIQQLNETLLQQINETQTKIEEIMRRLGTLQSFPALSCADLLPSLPSDYYWIRSFDGSAVRVFCDMNFTCGNITGWVKVAQIDYNNTDPCPKGFVKRNESNLDTCVPARSTRHSCVTLDTFSTFGLPYTQVCGRVTAYQVGTTKAFARSISTRHPLIINLPKLDGISLTHGKCPRSHIWSFPVGAAQNSTGKFGCPCNNGFNKTRYLPNFLHSNYFCDSAPLFSDEEDRSFHDDPLFDGVGCNEATTNCCSFNSPPWFYRQLPKSTIDTIEVRICRGKIRRMEGIPIQVIDLYIQ